MNDYSLEEEDERIPSSIADIAAMVAVLFGLSAEATCAVQVLIISSDALENSWKAGKHPVLIFSVVLRRVS